MKVEKLENRTEEYPHRSKYPSFVIRIEDLDDRAVLERIRRFIRPKLQGKIRRPADKGFTSWGFLSSELGPAGYEFYLSNPADFLTVFESLQELPSVVDIELVGQWWHHSSHPLLSLRRLRPKKFKTCNQDWLKRVKRQAQCSELLTSIKASDNDRFCIKLAKSIELKDCLDKVQMEVEMVMLYGCPTKGDFLDFLHEPAVVLAGEEILTHVTNCVNGKLRTPVEESLTWQLPEWLFLKWNRYDLLCIYQDADGKRYARTKVCTATGPESLYLTEYHVFYREV